MPSTQEEINALKAARLELIEGRTARVTIGGVTREFLNLKDLNDTIWQLTAQLAASTGKSQRAQVRFE